MRAKHERAARTVVFAVVEIDRFIPPYSLGFARPYESIRRIELG